jgi:hypothetical protein
VGHLPESYNGGVKLKAIVDRQNLQQLFVTSILAILVIVGCTGPPSTPSPTPPEVSFAIHLQEGFTGDFVRITVNDEILFEGRPATDPRLGIAEQIQSTAKSSTITLGVEVSGEQLLSSRAIDVSKGHVIGLSLVSGEVKVVQAEAFGYD